MIGRTLALAGGRLASERSDADGPLLVAAVELDLDLVARPVALRKRVAELGNGADALSVGRDEQIAAEPVPLPGDHTTSVVPPRGPAFAAGLVGSTRSSRRPLSTGRRKTRASSGVTVVARTPTYARSTRPVSSSCATTVLTVLEGTANPIPTLPTARLRRRSRSGS